MANMIDLLLNSDIEQIERPTCEIEIKRLSDIFGEKFTLLCKALTYTKYSEIQEKCIDIDMNTGKTSLDIEKMEIEMVLNGVFNVADGTRFFSNKELHKKFNVPNSKEFMKKLLLSGEISKLSTKINDLSGYGKENLVEEVKN